MSNIGGGRRPAESGKNGRRARWMDAVDRPQFNQDTVVKALGGRGCIGKSGDRRSAGGTGGPDDHQPLRFDLYSKLL